MKERKMTSQHRTKTCLLLLSFTFFWIWQIVQPVLDEHLPSIIIGPHTNLTLPLSEVISQYLGAATLLSGYALYFTVSYGQLSFGMNSAFMLPAFMIVSGHGMHVACVTIQVQMTKQDPLYALVYFLHEHWSHNTFLMGFYGLVLLLIWAERQGSKCAQNPAIRKHNQVPRPKLLSSIHGSQVLNEDGLREKLAATPKSKATAGSCQGTVPKECTKSTDTTSIATIDSHKNKNGRVNHRNNIIHANSCANGTLPSTSRQCFSLPTGCSMRDKTLTLQPGVKVREAGGKEFGNNTAVQGGQTTTLMANLIVFCTTRVLPIIMGVYFSVFASLTSTKPLTMLFYVGVLSYQMTLFYYNIKGQLSFCGLSGILKFLDSDEMIVGGFFTKAVLIGLPLMLVDFE
jgi:hypothetical protein